MSTEISFPDYLALRNLVFEWAASYDNKDWERLHKCLAPSIRLDFRPFGGQLHEALTPDGYVELHQGIIGDKRLKTQHLIGASKYQVLSDGRIQGSHQLRVAHQRYSSEDLKEVVNKGHGHGYNVQLYRKIEGVWKIEGVAPDVLFSEYDLPGTLNPEEKNTGGL